MKQRFFPDANVLLYALNKASKHHFVCKTWLDKITAEGSELFITDLTECALLRIATLPTIAFATTKIGMQFWNALLDYPQIERCSPGRLHREIFQRFVRDLNLSGNDMNDAWLAALAMEHRTLLVSVDQGFSRFDGLQWLNLLPT